MFKFCRDVTISRKVDNFGPNLHACCLFRGDVSTPVAFPGELRRPPSIVCLATPLSKPKGRIHNAIRSAAKKGPLKRHRELRFAGGILYSLPTTSRETGFSQYSIAVPGFPNWLTNPSLSFSPNLTFLKCTIGWHIQILIIFLTLDKNS